MSNQDMERTIEEIENDVWTEIEFPTNLIKKCFELRKTKLKNLDSEGLRILIEQGIGLVYILPLAIRNLNENILMEGGFYPGDLLQSVLNVDCKVWISNRQLFIEIQSIVNNRMENIKEADIINNEIKMDIINNFNKFQKCIEFN
jgi:hypothetical protein